VFSMLPEIRTQPIRVRGRPAGTPDEQGALLGQRPDSRGPDVELVYPVVFHTRFSHVMAKDEIPLAFPHEILTGHFCPE